MSAYLELSQNYHDTIKVRMFDDFDKIFRYYDAEYFQSRCVYIEVTQH